MNYLLDLCQRFAGNGGRISWKQYIDAMNHLIVDCGNHDMAYNFLIGVLSTKNITVSE